MRLRAKRRSTRITESGVKSQCRSSSSTGVLKPRNSANTVRSGRKDTGKVVKRKDKESGRGNLSKAVERVISDEIRERKQGGSAKPSVKDRRGTEVVKNEERNMEVVLKEGKEEDEKDSGLEDDTQEEDESETDSSCEDSEDKENDDWNSEEEEEKERKRREKKSFPLYKPKTTSKTSTVELSTYEKKRLETINENNAFLQSLQLDELKMSLMPSRAEVTRKAPRVKRFKAKPKVNHRKRESSRLRGLPAPKVRLFLSLDYEKWQTGFYLTNMKYRLMKLA